MPTPNSYQTIRPVLTFRSFLVTLAVLPPFLLGLWLINVSFPKKPLQEPSMRSHFNPERFVKDVPLHVPEEPEEVQEFGPDVMVPIQADGSPSTQARSDTGDYLRVYRIRLTFATLIDTYPGTRYTDDFRDRAPVEGIFYCHGEMTNPSLIAFLESEGRSSSPFIRGQFTQILAILRKEKIDVSVPLAHVWQEELFQGSIWTIKQGGVEAELHYGYMDTSVDPPFKNFVPIHFRIEELRSYPLLPPVTPPAPLSAPEPEAP